MALLDFHLDPRSGVPLYVQLMQQVRHALVFGMLQPGDRLPTVKEVVAKTAINPNTVLRAYRELETAGLVVSRAGAGTFVTDAPAAPLPSDSYRNLRAALERWIEKARAEGLANEAIASLVSDVLRAGSEQVA